MKEILVGFLALVCSLVCSLGVVGLVARFWDYLVPIILCSAAAYFFLRVCYYLGDAILHGPR